MARKLYFDPGRSLYEGFRQGEADEREFRKSIEQLRAARIQNNAARDMYTDQTAMRRLRDREISRLNDPTNPNAEALVRAQFDEFGGSPTSALNRQENLRREQAIGLANWNWYGGLPGVTPSTPVIPATPPNSSLYGMDTAETFPVAEAEAPTVSNFGARTSLVEPLAQMAPIGQASAAGRVPAMQSPPASGLSSVLPPSAVAAQTVAQQAPMGFSTAPASQLSAEDAVLRRQALGYLGSAIGNPRADSLSKANQFTYLSSRVPMGNVNPLDDAVDIYNKYVNPTRPVDARTLSVLLSDPENRDFVVRGIDQGRMQRDRDSMQEAQAELNRRRVSEASAEELYNLVPEAFQDRGEYLGVGPLADYRGGLLNPGADADKLATFMAGDPQYMQDLQNLLQSSPPDQHEEIARELARRYVERHPSIRAYLSNERR